MDCWAAATTLEPWGRLEVPWGHGDGAILLFSRGIHLFGKREKGSWEANSLMKYATKNHFKSFVEQGLACLGVAEKLATPVFQNFLPPLRYWNLIWIPPHRVLVLQALSQSMLFQKQRLSN